MTRGKAESNPAGPHKPRRGFETSSQRAVEAMEAFYTKECSNRVHVFGENPGGQVKN